MIKGKKKKKNTMYLRFLIMKYLMKKILNIRFIIYKTRV